MIRSKQRYQYKRETCKAFLFNAHLLLRYWIFKGINDREFYESVCLTKPRDSTIFTSTETRGAQIIHCTALKKTFPFLWGSTSTSSSLETLDLIQRGLPHTHALANKHFPPFSALPKEVTEMNFQALLEKKERQSLVFAEHKFFRFSLSTW